MDFNEEFREILKAYTGAERIVSVDAEPLRRAVIALRQCAAKVIVLELHNAARAIKGNPVFCDWLERRAKEIEGGE